jgi:hypothetical protein
MISPSWLADVFAVIVLAIALFSAARLIASRGLRHQDEVDADGVHVLMGVAMAGMFVPRLATLPTPLWEVIFAVGAVWFGWRAVQVRRARLAGQPGDAGHSGHLASAAHCCRYPVPHLIDCVAMLYMFWAVAAFRFADGAASSGTGGVGGMAVGGARLPVLGLTLALLICGYVVWLGDRFQLLSSPLPIGPVPASPVPASPVPAGDLVVAPSPARSFLAPRAATCCKIAMGVAMGVMLVDLL